jgi:hypothetical protein
MHQIEAVYFTDILKDSHLFDNMASQFCIRSTEQNTCNGENANGGRGLEIFLTINFLT